MLFPLELRRKTGRQPWRSARTNVVVAAVILTGTLAPDWRGVVECQGQGLQVTDYQVVLLRRHTAAGPEQQRRAVHWANLLQQALDRRVLWYGSLTDGSDVEAVAIVAGTDKEAVAKVFDRDPLVMSKYLVPEGAVWSGPVDVFSAPRDMFAAEQLVVGFLKRGSGLSKETDASEIARQHLDRMVALQKQRKVLVAGLLTQPADCLGLLVYRVATVEEARALAARDPAIKAGRLTLDAHTVFTPKGILK